MNCFSDWLQLERKGMKTLLNHSNNPPEEMISTIPTPPRQASWKGYFPRILL